MKRFLRFGMEMAFLLAALLLGAPAAQADGGKALVNNDYVRVREKPNKDATSLGFLYKNMMVEIRSQTQSPDKIGNDSFYWYEVKSKEVSGWVYGKFLTPSAANWNVDTYDAPGDVDFLSRRFGESTWYATQKMNMTSFSMEDYRNLMVAAANGSEMAWDALRVTILQHLKENPYDANYAYLKKRLYSDEFLQKVIVYPFVFNDQELLDLVPIPHTVVAKALGTTGLAAQVPDEYWQDKEFVAQVMNSPSGCSFADRAEAFRSDPRVKAALNRCQGRR